MEVILGLSPFVVVHPTWLGHSPHGRSFFGDTISSFSFSFHALLLLSDFSAAVFRTSPKRAGKETVGQVRQESRTFLKK